MPSATVRANAQALPEETNRRAVLRGMLITGVAVATPQIASAAATAAAAEPIDPVFAAIERHWAAHIAYGATCNQTDNVLAEREGREVTQADEDANAAACAAEDDALSELLETVPITVAGIRALDKYPF